MRDKLFVLFIFLLLTFSLTSCSEESSKSLATDETWAIYWYLCGSDLESEYGLATDDLLELMDVDLPENVKVIIQTGGTRLWQNNTVDENYSERYVYDQDGLTLISQNEITNMGDPSTFADFLAFAEESYKADRRAILFWNHGGGTVGGVAYDEQYDYDSLSLGEMYMAFSEVFELLEDSPPFELIGFDTCLMATIDAAFTFCDVAKYMVASEELMPGNGWDYTGWLSALGNDPSMDGAELGTVMCDTYLESSLEEGTASEATMSVMNLSNVWPLLYAYDNLGKEALTIASREPAFFSELGRSALAAENYGGNTKEQGYSNMVDLGSFVKNAQNIFSEDTINAVLSCIEDCVVYKVNGEYRREAMGVSCFYSYDGNHDNYREFVDVGFSTPFKYLYEYRLNGVLSDEGMEYIGLAGYDNATVPDFDISLLDEYPLFVDDESCAVLNIGGENAEMLTSVYFILYYVDEDADYMINLGRDNDLDGDWTTGYFRDNFRGVWGSIEDNFVYMDISVEGDGYNVYSVPILLNGEDCYLSVVYDFLVEEWEILGARKSSDGNGMTDKNLIQLKTGDEIIPILYGASISGDDEFERIEGEAFTWKETAGFEEMDMGDGSFLMVYEMTDFGGNIAYSNFATFTVEGDDIYVETDE
ncbi:MAG: clostripain [Clostridia bacterium]|nr:clostripain [Clostridia bacterium]